MDNSDVNSGLYYGEKVPGFNIDEIIELIPMLDNQLELIN
jgi:hypothetical protein